MAVCILCRELCFDEQPLSTGDVLHSACLGKVQEREAAAIRELNALLAEQLRLASELRRAATFTGRVWQLLQGQAADLEPIRQRVAALEIEIPRLQQLSEHAQIIVGQIYNYWPDYPPDWSTRRVEALSKHSVCADCGRRNKLHVHHVLPIASGGSHKQQNLAVLCELCHRRRHGGRAFTYDDEKSVSAFERKLQTLRTGIAAERCVQFHYRKASGEESSRRLRPTGFVTKSGVTCVTGFCYLRNAERFFSVRRISGLKFSD
jgi:hypothetical protein